MLADHISTKYKDRAQSLQEIADLIYHTVSRKLGNYMVIFLHTGIYLMSITCLLPPILK